VLPEADCPPGTMAIPGDAECRGVGSCGEGKWGDLPTGASTHYVDGAFSGASDGTAERPWSTIADGVANAPAGGLVAVAAGTYLEDLMLDKPVRLHGVCADQVTLRGTGQAQATIGMYVGSDGAEVAGVGITGPAIGVLVAGSVDLVLDRVRLYDLGSRGVNVQDDIGPTSLTVQDSIIENVQEFGIFVAGATVVVDSTVVRDVAPVSPPDLGRGINARDGVGGAPTQLLVTRSVIARTHQAGVFIEDTEATIDGSVVRDTVPLNDAESGRGINVQGIGIYWTSLVLTRSLVANNHSAGVYVADAEAVLEGVIIRDTAPGNTGVGRGLDVEGEVELQRTVSLRSSLLLRNTEFGAFFAGVEVTIDSTRISTTAATGRNGFNLGHALQVRDGPNGLPGTLSMTASLLEDCEEAGLSVVHSTVMLDNVAVRTVRTTSKPPLRFGDGVLVVSSGDGAAYLRNSLVAHAARAGIAAFGSHVELEATTLDCNAIDINGETNDTVESSLADSGGNRCGCGADERDCHILSTALEPPSTDY